MVSGRKERPEAPSREELCMSRMARPVWLEGRSDGALRECLGPDHDGSGGEE